MSLVFVMIDVVDCAGDVISSRGQLKSCQQL